MRFFCLFLLFLLFPGDDSSAGHDIFPYDAKNTVVGGAETYEIKERQSLHEVARKFDLGYNEIVDANPGIDPWVPAEGASVSIPSAWVLPGLLNSGIIINLAEMRLYHFMKDKGRRYVKTYPIGIGREGFSTPTGTYRIIEKIKDPVWMPPPSLKNENIDSPESVEAGPDNPLGAYALRLSSPLYLIHGTNKPFGVGRRVSRGCLRLYPEDIEDLYGSVKIGTVVRIVYEPLKVGTRENRVFVEVHKDYMDKVKEPFWAAIALLKRRRLLDKTDTELLKTALEGEKGIPTDVGIRLENQLSP